MDQLSIKFDILLLRFDVYDVTGLGDQQLGSLKQTFVSEFSPILMHVDELNIFIDIQLGEDLYAFVSLFFTKRAMEAFLNEALFTQGTPEEHRQVVIFAIITSEGHLQFFPWWMLALSPQILQSGRRRNRSRIFDVVINIWWLLFVRFQVNRVNFISFKKFIDEDIRALILSDPNTAQLRYRSKLGPPQLINIMVEAIWVLNELSGRMFALDGQLHFNKDLVPIQKID